MTNQRGLLLHFHARLALCAYDQFPNLYLHHHAYITITRRPTRCHPQSSYHVAIQVQSTMSQTYSKCKSPTHEPWFDQLTLRYLNSQPIPSSIFTLQVTSAHPPLNQRRRKSRRIPRRWTTRTQTMTVSPFPPSVTTHLMEGLVVVPTPPINLAKSNEPTVSKTGNASSGARIDQDLAREDEELIARKEEAKAQQAQSGKDATF